MVPVKTVDMNIWLDRVSVACELALPHKPVCLAHCSAVCFLVAEHSCNMQSVPQGQIYQGSFAHCCTEMKVVNQTCHLIKSVSTETGPANLNSGLVTPGVCQVTRPLFKSLVWLNQNFKPGSSAQKVDYLTTRLSRFCLQCSGTISTLI